MAFTIAVKLIVRWVAINPPIPEAAAMAPNPVLVLNHLTLGTLNEKHYVILLYVEDEVNPVFPLASQAPGNGGLFDSGGNMNWKKHPTHKAAHVAFTDEVKAEVIGSRPPKTQVARARVEYDTFRKTAEIGVMVDRALVHQAGEAEKSGLHRHHPKAFDSVGNWVRDALVGVKRGSGAWSDLSFLAEKLVPFLDEYGIPGKEHIYRHGNIGKSRCAANFVRVLLKKPNPSAVPIIESVMRDLADDGVKLRQFRQRYIRKPRTSACPAYAVGNFVIVACRDDEERQRIQSTLSEKVIWRDKPKQAIREINLLAKP